LYYIKGFYSKLQSSKLYKNLFSLSISQFGNYVIPLLVMPYLTRTLGPDKFGLVTFAQVFISYFTLIVNYGFDYTITRTITANKDDKAALSSIFWNVFYAKLFLFVISSIVLLALFEVPRFGNTWWLIVTTHLINIGFIFYPSWFFQGMQDLRILALLSFLIKLCYAVLIFFFVNGEGDYILNNLFLSLSQVAIGIAAVIIAVKKYDISVAPLQKALIRSFLINGRFFFLSTLVINAYSYTNTFLLGLLSTERETAYFNVVYRIIFAIQGLLLVPFNMAFFPYISASFSSNDYVNSDKKLLKACGLILLTTFLCGIFLFFAAEPIVLFLFGKQFLESIPLLRMLAFIPMLMGLVNVFGFNGLMPVHQDKTFLYITIVGGCISISLNLILIPTYKSYAVACVWMLTEFTIGTLCFLFYKRALKRKMA
jgi:O-antigen/teichoic acid export membrane protein